VKSFQSAQSVVILICVILVIKKPSEEGLYN
jgi:hypothetical protein